MYHTVRFVWFLMLALLFHSQVTTIESVQVFLSDTKHAAGSRSDTKHAAGSRSDTKHAAGSRSDTKHAAGSRLVQLIFRIC